MLRSYKEWVLFRTEIKIFVPPYENVKNDLNFG